MKKERAWVWFKGGLKGGSWEAGFLATRTEEGPILIEKQDFVACQVPEWRVRLDEPTDLRKGPLIPEDATWKYFK